MPLNAEQKIAVATRQGYTLVIAAPGSGKTRVIVQRVLDITRTDVHPSHILSTTFTREAASEMANRAARYTLGCAPGEKVSQSRLDKEKRTSGLEVPYGHHVFCTFHSLALRFIKANYREFFSQLQPQILASGSETGRAIRDALRATGMKAGRKKDLVHYISKSKRMRITPDQAAEDAENSGGDFSLTYADAYSSYEKSLAESGVLDFDSLLVEMCGLLEKNAEVRSRWQFKYVQIDEAQDTDVLQWAIIGLITEKHKNLFAVGDENQGMYSFRGAESELGKNFLERYPDAKVLILPENYRSTKSIVEFCKEIAPLQNETVLKLRTANALGEPPVFARYGDQDEEAMSVLNKVKDVPHTAILTRTNAQLQPYESACTDRKIPFRILGKGGFWRQHEVETCMAFVRCLVSPTENALLKVIRSPYSCVRTKRDTKDNVIKWLAARKKEVGEAKLLDELRNYSYPLNELPAMFDEVRGHRLAPGKLVELLFQRAGAVTYYKDKSDEADLPDNDRLENINRLITLAGRSKSLMSFVVFANRARHDNRSSKDSMTLSTIHKAKGLEWLDVFVVGVNEGKLPSIHAIGPAELDEERRVFFVACSRAARRLHVSCGDVPSMFIDQRLPPVNPAVEELDYLESMYQLAQEGSV